MDLDVSTLEAMTHKTVSSFLFCDRSFDDGEEPIIMTKNALIIVFQRHDFITVTLISMVVMTFHGVQKHWICAFNFLNIF